MASPRSVCALLPLLAFVFLGAGSALGAEPNVPSDPKYLDGWRMAGANPERTSWVPEDVPGKLQLEWYRPFEPFISPKVQVIAADGVLFIATARGLYALDAETCDERWIYPTELPLGHSPTVIDGIVYTPGRKCTINPTINGAAEATADTGA